MSELQKRPSPRSSPRPSPPPIPRPSPRSSPYPYQTSLIGTGCIAEKDEGANGGSAEIWEPSLYKCGNGSEEYILDILLPKTLYRKNNLRIESCYIEVEDVLKILNGEKDFIQNVSASYHVEFKDENEKKLMLIIIQVNFQYKANLKPNQEIHEFELEEVHRDHLVEDVTNLKKRVCDMSHENDMLKKRVKLFGGYFDMRMKPLSYKFHFTIDSTISEEFFEIQVRLIDPGFKMFLSKHERFRTINKEFNGSEFSHKINWLTQDNYLENSKYFLNWMIDWETNENFMVLAPKSISEMQIYLRQRDFIADVCRDQKMLIDNVIMTLFDLNLEYEFKDVLLLPPSLMEPRYQCIEKPCVSHKFNLEDCLEKLISYKDGYFFNPNIGFYKCPIELIELE
jgi:hypothetical protein